ncbi:hypothetical protein ACI5KX_05025 [Erythrobacter sp. GH1-10]|uniref:hypothetical protein n=1 Tax=Erythrobacter sp. GH1-10 TaxID=3349334 RepID=UPI003877C5A6
MVSDQHYRVGDESEDTWFRSKPGWILLAAAFLMATASYIVGTMDRGESEAPQALGQQAPADQRAMVEGMVTRLETRLQSEPQDIEGWVMLMRSRMTLGQPDRATAALNAAIAANPDQADQLRQQAQQLGVR